MKKTLIVLLMILGIASIVEAKCLRCGVKLLCTGESRFDAISKCGEPDYSEETTVTTKGTVNNDGMSFVRQKVEQLYYNCGEGRFVEILTIQNGKIVSITEGDRGSGPEKCR